MSIDRSTETLGGAADRIITGRTACENPAISNRPKAGKTEAEKLFQDLSKPSLHALSYALRHPDTWPEDFVWDYRQCDQCAMGLAHALWNSIPEVGLDNGATVMARSFAMPYKAADAIFFGSSKWLPTKDKVKTTGSLWWKEEKVTRVSNLKAVTPDMVADQIDAYLATAE